MFCLVCGSLLATNDAKNLRLKSTQKLTELTQNKSAIVHKSLKIEAWGVPDAFGGGLGAILAEGLGTGGPRDEKPVRGTLRGTPKCIFVGTFLHIFGISLRMFFEGVFGRPRDTILDDFEMVCYVMFLFFVRFVRGAAMVKTSFGYVIYCVSGIAAFSIKTKK